MKEIMSSQKEDVKPKKKEKTESVQEINPCTGCKYEIKGNKRACETCIHDGLKGE